MKEEIIQRHIIDVIEKKELMAFIKGNERLNEAINIDLDDSFAPFFSIDGLLKKRYSESAKRVLESLGSYELISGKIIRNISLEKSDRLFPDVLLFNSGTMQLIIIENKSNAQTEREALTELLSYAHEIKNHLPFLSNYDISYILIATNYNELIDHAVAAQILSGPINILCLKPEIKDDKVTGLDIYFPKSWTNIGEAGLPKNSLMSYTLFLYEKEELPIENFDSRSVVSTAADLILHQANNFHSSGFFIIWENAHQKDISDFRFGLTIYILNPYSFLTNAYNLNFPLNERSVLSQYLMTHTKTYGTGTFPTSLFGIANQAEQYLNDFFDSHWSRASDWLSDTRDHRYRLQCHVAFWESWGAIGDYVRYIFLHPSSKHASNNKIQIPGGYKNPFNGLQIINQISGNELFRHGEFTHTEIFHFGLQIGFYLEACRNALTLQEHSKLSYNANLFWAVLPLIQSLNEVTARVNDSFDLEPYELTFPLALYKEAIDANYRKKIQGFTDWFKSDFIDARINPTLALIFQYAIDYSWYFSDFLGDAIPVTERRQLDKLFARLTKAKVLEISLDRIKNPENNKEILDFINQTYFDDQLLKMKTEQLKAYLDQKKDLFYADYFEHKFLALLDLIKGGLLHRLKPLSLSRNIDWEKYYDTACKLFNGGNKKIAVICDPNGKVGLGTIESVMSLENKDEIFVQFFPGSSKSQMTIRVQWSELLNGTFKMFK